MSTSHISARTLQTLLGDWRGPGPAYRGLADRIRLLVLDGRVAADTRLPAERDLAERLALSRTTVTAAYGDLRDDGYVHSVRGSGSRTCLPARTTVAPGVSAGGYLDLTKAAMPAVAELAGAARHAVDDLAAHLGDTGYDPVGLSGLRQAIALRYREHGLPTDPDQIMVTLGAQHAVSLLSRTLLARGDRALVEMPTYPHAYEALRAGGARLVPVPVSAVSGWDEPVLTQSLRRTSPALAYLIPDFQNPTGQSMPPEVRERVIAAAYRQGTLLIADETTAELDIDRPERLAPFAAYGEQDTVVSVGSMGKTAWGGLRVGWIRAAPGLIRKLVAARASNDLGTPILEQLIAIRLLDQLDSILAHGRERRRLGRDHLEQALAIRFPHWEVPHVHGGLAVWAHLGAPVSSQLALAARGHGLLIAAGPRFGVDGAFERFMRIPISLDPAQTDQAVGALAAAWASLSMQAEPETSYLAAVV